MKQRQVVSTLKPIVGLIIQDVQADWLEPQQLAVYCGRQVVRVRALQPAERPDPEANVLIALEPDCDPHPVQGIFLRSRWLQEIQCTEHQSRIGQQRLRLYSQGDQVLTLILAPAGGRSRYPDVLLPGYHTAPGDASNRPQTDRHSTQGPPDHGTCQPDREAECGQPHARPPHPAHTPWAKGR